MEKLQQAIERARQERQGKIGQVPSFEQIKSQGEGVQRSPMVSNNRAQRNSSDDPSPKTFVVQGPPPNPIVYSDTRVELLNGTHVEKNRVVAMSRGDERVEAYRMLRTQVLQTLNENRWQTLAITSPMNNAGKTLTAVNLAISLAREVNHTVLLVDLDLTHPDVHTTLGVNLEYGLIDVLNGRATISQTLFNPGIQRLVVLPCRPTEEYSSELLTSPDMVALLEELKTRYEHRIVIFDLPPLLRNDDALKFTPFADATLMVVEAGETTPEQLKRATQLAKNANLIGTILNKAR